MRKTDAAAALMFIALSVAMTWPMAWNLDRAVSDPGDPYITIWILDWDWYATFHKPLSLFHANAFHPAKYSLAYSENLYGIALLLFPLRALGVGPVVAHNLAFLAGYAFCGFAAYLLGKRLTGSWIAGMAAGVFYAFVPFRFVHLSHIQHIWGGWLPLLLLMLLRYAGRPSRKRAFLFAAVFVMNGLTNIHYLFFGALAAAITAAIALPRLHWRELAIATACALVVLAPFLYPYAAVAKLYDMQRTADEVARFSAMPSDWLPGQTEAELRLFPGWLAYAVALCALFARKQRPQLFLGLLWIALGFAGSLGLNFVFHEFLFGGVPGFRALRVPARWASIAYVGIAILIAVATALLARRSRVAALLVPVAFAVTLWRAPIRWYLFEPRTPPVYEWLAKQKVSAIAELPIDSLSSDYDYMLRATAHHKPFIGGISGFAPPLRMELSRMSKETPIPDAFVDALRNANVELLIVHADALGGARGEVFAWLQREMARGRLSYVRTFDTPIDGDWVFSLEPTGRITNFAPYCGEGTMGALDDPPANVHFNKQAIFSGWTMSRHGIRSVDVWFDNRTYRHRARLYPEASLEKRCPGVPNMTRTRYIAEFAERPRGVRRETDVQVEVTDGRGVKTVFDDRWFTWE